MERSPSPVKVTFWQLPKVWQWRHVDVGGHTMEKSFFFFGSRVCLRKDFKRTREAKSWRIEANCSSSKSAKILQYSGASDRSSAFLDKYLVFRQPYSSQKVRPRLTMTLIGLSSIKRSNIAPSIDFILRYFFSLHPKTRMRRERSHGTII